MAAPILDAARHRDKALMLVATAARMAAGLLTFIVLARFLGPVAFGIVATAMAYTGLIGLLSDFGFPVSALRRASAEPQHAGRIVGEALVVKLLLTLVLTLAGAVIAVRVLPGAWLPVYAIVHLGTVAFSCADLTLVIARARRRFDIEARLVVASSVMMLVVVAGVTAFTRNVLDAAIAFAAARVAYLVLTVLTIGRWVAPIGVVRRDVATIATAIGGSARYALDGILTALSGQVDVLLFGALLSAHDMGVYQAGSRLVQVVMPFAVVFSTVYMPTLASAAIGGSPDAFRRSARRLNVEFTGLAILGGLAFALGGPIVTRSLYGARYDALLPLWPGFGAFVVLRFASAGYGIQLAALGNIGMRIAAQLASILAFVATAAVILPRGGLAATSWLLAGSALPVLLVLGGSLWRDARTGAGPWSIAIALAAALAVSMIGPVMR